MLVYHVVTDRPMHTGQIIRFDDTHRSGVYHRVYSRLDLVREIYARPGDYSADLLEHHTAVALRELALEEVRLAEYPEYPSRLACLYVSLTLQEAEDWAAYFVRLGRPVCQIVLLDVCGRLFAGDAAKCFRGSPDRQENLRLARRYWRNDPGDSDAPPVREALADGTITVVEVIREISAKFPDASKPSRA